jgi:hypothetical protein
MGWLVNSNDENDECRGATAEQLRRMSNEQIIICALRRLLGEYADDVLAEELKRRMLQP